MFNVLAARSGRVRAVEVHDSTLGGHPIEACLAKVLEETTLPLQDLEPLAAPVSRHPVAPHDRGLLGNVGLESLVRLLFTPAVLESAGIILMVKAIPWLGYRRSMSEPLLDVLKAGDGDRLAELLASGADPNTPFQSRYGISSGYTPLQVAVAELNTVAGREPGGPIGAVILLLRHGARVNDWDESRDTTALLNAVFIDHIEAVRILLAAGADPNVHDSEGDSPLRFCAQHGYLEMARLLLHCGADKTIHEAGGSAGMNALGFAVNRLNLDMVRRLLAHGADPWVEDLDRMHVFDHLRILSLPEDPEAQERLRQICQLFDDMKARGPSQMALDRNKKRYL